MDRGVLPSLVLVDGSQNLNYLYNTDQGEVSKTHNIYIVFFSVLPCKDLNVIEMKESAV